jgi:Holliday junction resolvase
MVNAKRKGTKNEHKAIKFLEASGYSCTRSAGSLGIFDIVAIGVMGIRLVQVKTNRDAPLYEREQIKMFLVPTGVTKEIWIYKDYSRAPIINII